MIDVNANRKFFQKINLPDGAVTNGITDHTRDPAILGVDGAFMSGRRTLDIGANDGFWTFWAEVNGASEAVAIDVDRYEKYDWGYEVPDLKRFASHSVKDDNFVFLKEQYGFKAKRFNNSVYDLNENEHGRFDCVFFYGVLYHLRHPLLAFDKIRSVCDGVVFVETHLNGINHHVPSSVFYRDDVFGSVTNWTGPTQACVAQWMYDAGFPFVFLERKRKGPLRGRFIGCANSGEAENFMKNDSFVFCDNEYFSRVRDETLKEIDAAKAP